TPLSTSSPMEAHVERPRSDELAPTTGPGTNTRPRGAGGSVIATGRSVAAGGGSVLVTGRSAIATGCSRVAADNGMERQPPSPAQASSPPTRPTRRLGDVMLDQVDRARTVRSEGTCARVTPLAPPQSSDPTLKMEPS